jgi:ribosome-associated translation inhibitor RaiA
MSEPVFITFRNMSAHQALSDAVLSRAHWLERFDPQVAGCRVALEFPHRHQKHGRPFSIHIQVSVPGNDVTVSHEASLPPSVAAFYEADAEGGDHRDAIAAINDAFDIARRRVEDAARKRRAV